MHPLNAQTVVSYPLTRVVTATCHDNQTFEAKCHIHLTAATTTHPSNNSSQVYLILSLACLVRTVPLLIGFALPQNPNIDSKLSLLDLGLLLCRVLRLPLLVQFIGTQQHRQQSPKTLSSQHHPHQQTLSLGPGLDSLHYHCHRHYATATYPSTPSLMARPGTMTLQITPVFDERRSIWCYKAAHTANESSTKHAKMSVEGAAPLPFAIAIRSFTSTRQSRSIHNDTTINPTNNTQQ